MVCKLEEGVVDRPGGCVSEDSAAAGGVPGDIASESVVASDPVAQGTGGGFDPRCGFKDAA